MNKILIDLVELETALDKAETYAEMEGKNHAYVKGLRAAQKIALSCDYALIRCKDCRYKREKGSDSINPTIHYWCELHRHWSPDDWFCADGKRSVINE